MPRGSYPNCEAQRDDRISPRAHTQKMCRQNIANPSPSSEEKRGRCMLVMVGYWEEMVLYLRLRVGSSTSLLTFGDSFCGLVLASHHPVTEVSMLGRLAHTLSLRVFTSHPDPSLCRTMLQALPICSADVIRQRFPDEPVSTDHRLGVTTRAPFFFLPTFLFNSHFKERFVQYPMPIYKYCCPCVV